LDRDETYITIGKLGKSRGISGEIWVTVFSDFPERFVDLTEVFLRGRGSWEKRKLESARLVSGRPVLKFEGVDTPEDASRLTNRELAVTRDEVVELPEGMFYIFDLIGCRVFAGENGDDLGEVIDVRQYPANDAYVIRMNDGRLMSLAAVVQFIKHVDVEKKQIVIDSAGLVETS
jgi:16S rRNA processing protein RimM